MCSKNVMMNFQGRINNIDGGRQNLKIYALFDEALNVLNELTQTHLWLKEGFCIMCPLCYILHIL